MPAEGQTCCTPHLDATDDRLHQPPHPCAGVSCTCHLDVTIQLLLAASRCTAHQPWATPRPAGHSQGKTQIKLRPPVATMAWHLEEGVSATERAGMLHKLLLQQLGGCHRALEIARCPMTACASLCYTHDHDGCHSHLLISSNPLQPTGVLGCSAGCLLFGTAAVASLLSLQLPLLLDRSAAAGVVQLTGG